MAFAFSSMFRGAIFTVLLFACPGAQAAKHVAANNCGSDDHQLYFGYGSNVDGAYFAERLKEGEWTDDGHKSGYNSNRPPIDLGCYALDGHKFAYNLVPPGEKYASATVRPQPGQRVYGVLWDISKGDLHKLDVDEDVPRDYYRACLAISPCHATTTKKHYAWVYVGQAGALTDGIDPETDYVELLHKGARDHGLPPAYIKEVILGVHRSRQ